MKQPAGAIKARWVCEQAHLQLKEELGLDFFEGSMGRPAPIRADVHDRSCLPPVTSAQAGKRGETIEPATETKLFSNQASYH
ncbi:transposase [Sphingobium xenophagum]|uniref:Transposase n=1 Tax=Sphingobium xenophagum TaxID=121428 RepID=A0A401J6F4_SPHXE|nr:transposase [Sphingobium xenophagum]